MRTSIRLFTLVLSIGVVTLGGLGGTARAQGPAGNEPSIEGGAPFETFIEQFKQLVWWAADDEANGTRPNDNRHLRQIAPHINYPLVLPKGLVDGAVAEMDDIKTSDDRFAMAALSQIFITHKDAIITADAVVGEGDNHRQLNAKFVQPMRSDYCVATIVIDFVLEGESWKLNRIRLIGATWLN